MRNYFNPRNYNGYYHRDEYNPECYVATEDLMQRTALGRQLLSTFAEMVAPLGQLLRDQSWKQLNIMTLPAMKRLMKRHETAAKRYERQLAKHNRFLQDSIKAICQAEGLTEPGPSSIVYLDLRLSGCSAPNEWVQKRASANDKQAKALEQASTYAGKVLGASMDAFWVRLEAELDRKQRITMVNNYIQGELTDVVEGCLKDIIKARTSYKEPV